MYMERFIIDDIKLLFQKDQIHIFWPRNNMTYVSKANAICRFVLYYGIFISIYKKNFNHFVTAILFSLALSFIAKSQAIHFAYNLQPASFFPQAEKLVQKKCHLPTKDNPFSNILPSDSRDRLPACYYENVKEETEDFFNDGFVRDKFDFFNKKHSQRQFFTTANTNVPNDQAAFSHWLYGHPNKKMCKTDPEVCTGTENMMGNV